MPLSAEYSRFYGGCGIFLWLFDRYMRLLRRSQPVQVIETRYLPAARVVRCDIVLM